MRKPGSGRMVGTDTVEVFVFAKFEKRNPINERGPKTSAASLQSADCVTYFRFLLCLWIGATKGKATAGPTLNAVVPRH